MCDASHSYYRGDVLIHTCNFLGQRIYEGHSYVLSTAHYCIGL
jgi:hypothetical protein